MLCGVGVMFLQPWAIKYGRRLPYLVGSTFIMAGLIFGFKMASIGYTFAFFALAGFGSTPSYATIVTSLLDLTFLHEKGRLVEAYALTLLFGNFRPPIAAGYIISAQRWRWYFGYLLIFFSSFSLVILFTVEESNYERHYNGIPVRSENTVNDINVNAFRKMQGMESSICTMDEPPKKDAIQIGGHSTVSRAS